MEPAGETEWPEALWNRDGVRAWIAEELAGEPEIGGPERVYQATARTVTAQFTVAGAEPVVFKASAMDLCGGAPRIYDLLDRHCARHVPELVTSRQQKGQTWLIFRSFHGQPLDASPMLDGILALACTLARIQVMPAAAPPGSLSGLPHTHRCRRCRGCSRRCWATSARSTRPTGGGTRDRGPRCQSALTRPKVCRG
jgi:hypothetical protein